MRISLPFWVEGNNPSKSRHFARVFFPPKHFPRGRLDMTPLKWFNARTKTSAKPQRFPSALSRPLLWTPSSPALARDVSQSRRGCAEAVELTRGHPPQFQKSFVDDIYAGLGAERAPGAAACVRRSPSMLTRVLSSAVLPCLCGWEAAVA